MPAAILVCFAVPHEARLFQRRIAGHPAITILLTGIGRRNAERSIRRALTESHPRCVISSGFAGGLCPDLPCGSVVFDADPDFPFIRLLSDSSARPARFHCADHIIISAEAKAALRNANGADAVEMESQPIRQYCRELNIPSATIRVISDAANESLPLDFNQCLTGEHVFDYTKLLRLLVRSPRTLPPLVRFQKRVTAANSALCDLLCDLARAIPSRS